jgi:hypothetical protein
VGSFSGFLMLAKPGHTSVVELTNPFGKNGGLVGTRYVETGSPPRVGLISFGAIGVGDFIVLDAAFQRLDLSPESNCFPGMGFLDLADGADSPAQYPSEGGGIKVGDIREEGVQRAGGDGDWGRSGGPGDVVVSGAGVGGSLSRHDDRIVLAGREWEGRMILFIAAVRPLLCSRGLDR